MIIDEKKDSENDNKEESAADYNDDKEKSESDKVMEGLKKMYNESGDKPETEQDKIMKDLLKKYFESKDNEAEPEMEPEDDGENQGIAYEKILQLYDQKGKSKDVKHSLREKIRNKFREIYGKNKKWDELNDYQKYKFVCFDIKNCIMKNWEENSRKRVERKFIKEYDNIFAPSEEKTEVEYDLILKSLDKVEKYNEKFGNLWKGRCNADDTDAKKRYYHNVITETMTKYYPHIPIPAFKEYSEHPLSAYDYIMAYYMNNMPYPQLLSVNFVILQIIIQYLEQEHGLKIDIEKITECLCFLDLFCPNLDDMDEIPVVDSFKDLYLFAKWADCQEMLRTLTPFYKIEKKRKR